MAGEELGIIWSRICVLYDGKREKEKVHKMLIFVIFADNFFCDVHVKKCWKWVSVRIRLD